MSTHPKPKCSRCKRVARDGHTCPTPTPLARTTKVKARNVKRHNREWVRAYGSQDRVKFVKSLPCVVTGCGNAPSENMHTGTGGTGRKGDADTIVPACAEHHRFAHQHGIQTFCRSFPLPESLMVLASRTERLYQAYADGGWERGGYGPEMWPGRQC